MTTSDPDDRIEFHRASQRGCWEDLLAAAERDVVGLAVERRRLGGAEVMFVRGIGSAFACAYFNQASLGVAQARDGLSDLVAGMDAFGEPYSICLPAEADAALAMEALGFLRGPALALWARAPSQIAVPAVEARISRIEETRAADFLATLAEDTPEYVVAWHRAMVGRPGWDHFVAYVDGAPASGAVLVRQGQGGYLGWTRTTPLHRGRGLQRALLGARLERAVERGLTGVVARIVAPSADVSALAGGANPSARNARRCGFEAIGFDQVWVPRSHADAIFASVVVD